MVLYRFIMYVCMYVGVYVCRCVCRICTLTFFMYICIHVYAYLYVGICIYNMYVCKYENTLTIFIHVNESLYNYLSHRLYDISNISIQVGYVRNLHVVVLRQMRVRNMCFFFNKVFIQYIILYNITKRIVSRFG